MIIHDCIVANRSWFVVADYWRMNALTVVDAIHTNQHIDVWMLISFTLESILSADPTPKKYYLDQMFGTAVISLFKMKRLVHINH